MSDRTTRTALQSSERRVCFHYRMDQPARLLASRAELLPPGTAQLHDLSVNGLSLRLNGHIWPGCQLSVKFLRDGELTRVAGVEVTHSTAQDNGTWLVGCRLSLALTAEEMQELAAFKEPGYEPGEGNLPAVLVVDDEPGVRLMMGTYLQTHHIKVIEAASGEEAVALLQQPVPPIAMVFIGLRMPGLSGRDTLEAVKRSYPDLDCCLMGSDIEDEQELLAAGATCVLRKPFRLNQIDACLGQTRVPNRVTV